MTLPKDIAKDIDRDCRDLCRAMNKLPGIETTGCCCGHYKRPYWIHFRASSLDDLPRLLYYFTLCHCGFGGWSVSVNTDCSMAPVYFTIEGPVGELAYEQSKKIAELLVEEANR